MIGSGMGLSLGLGNGMGKAQREPGFLRGESGLWGLKNWCEYKKDWENRQTA